MLKEWKEFLMKGNVLDLAIGVIIGGAFGKIVTSFVNDILMPPPWPYARQNEFFRLVHQLERTTLPVACRRESRRRPDAQLRPVHQQPD